MRAADLCQCRPQSLDSRYLIVNPLSLVTLKHRQRLVVLLESLDLGAEFTDGDVVAGARHFKSFDLSLAIQQLLAKFVTFGLKGSDRSNVRREDGSLPLFVLVSRLTAVMAQMIPVNHGVVARIEFMIGDLGIHLYLQPCNRSVE
jgi:hypothetical protein